MKISVIIPVWNAENTIARAIDSALHQEFVESFEVVVVNDGSTDGTSRLLAGYGARVRVLNQKRRGPAAGRNAGVRASRGQYIAFLDADDIWLPDKLSKMVPVLDSQPGCVLVYSDVIQVDKTGRIKESFYVPKELSHAPSLEEMLSSYCWPILPSATVMRRSTFDLCGGFCEEFGKGYGNEDNYLWLLVRECGIFWYLPEPLALYTARTPRENFGKRVEYLREDNAENSTNELATLLESCIIGDRTLARLVEKRYGPQSETFSRMARREQVATLTYLALLAMNDSQYSRARFIYRAALRLKELRSKNGVRFLCTLLPWWITRLIETLVPARLFRTLFGPPLET